jgi:FAD/FMN-containing dehydrogenase
VLPAESVLWQREDTRPYECDGLSAYRQLPMVVALPRDEAEVMAVMRICAALKVPLVARGAGTGLSGGAYPHANGVLLSLAKMNRILQLDPLARVARVQPGVRNAAISEAAAPHGLYYAPDPSSQIACSIGGNVAENSGGVHCLKYGLTVNNVLRVRALVLGADGELSDAITLQLLRATAPWHTIGGPRRAVYRNPDGRGLERGSMGFVKHPNGAVQRIEHDSSGYYFVEWSTQRRIPSGPEVPYWILEDHR